MLPTQKGEATIAAWQRQIEAVVRPELEAALARGYGLRVKLGVYPDGRVAPVGYEGVSPTGKRE